jgi:hypothetical protein
VEATGRSVRTRSELATGVKLGEDNLDTAEPRLWFNVDGHTASFVSNFDAAVFVKLNLNGVSEAGKRLVNGVIDNLPEAVHETARIG